MCFVCVCVFVVAIDDDRYGFEKKFCDAIFWCFLCVFVFSKNGSFFYLHFRVNVHVSCVSNDSLSLSSWEYKQPFVGMGEKTMIEKKKERDENNNKKIHTATMRQWAITVSLHNNWLFISSIYCPCSAANIHLPHYVPIYSSKDNSKVLKASYRWSHCYILYLSNILSTTTWSKPWKR